MPISNRTADLKSRIVYKTCQGDWFTDDVKLCIERGRYWTESYKETVGEPEVIRRAKALEKTLLNMTLYIKDGELLVGNIASTSAHMPYYPEISTESARDAIRAKLIDEENLDEFNEIMDFWKGKTINQMVEKEFSEEELKIINACVQVASVDHRGGHTLGSPDYFYTMSNGLNGILAKIDAELEKLSVMPCDETMGEFLEKRHLFRAMKIAVYAVVKWAQRYSDLAIEKAKQTNDPARKAELMEIARICAKVPGNPPETFREALQFFIFIHFIDHHIERLATGISQRFDQIFYPYYKSDILDKRTAKREEAQELIECLWIKLAELGHFHIKERRDTYQGTNLLQIITIGGVDRFGQDASNDLTLLILDATKSIRLTQPSIALRYHNKLNPAVLDKAYDLIKTGMGMPSLHNDAVTIPLLMSLGANIEQARNAAFAVCMAPIVAGINMISKRHAWNLQPPLCLELALNNGVHRLSGRKLGPATGMPDSLNTYEEVFEAYRQQLSYALNLGARARSVTRHYEIKFMQRPFTSALFERTLEVGKDVMAWEEVCAPWINTCGQIDSADSLTAIKKLVFDDKKYTMSELHAALEADWVSHEDMRQDFINAPKFGNDDDYADEVAKSAFLVVDEETYKCQDYLGGHYTNVPQSVTRHMRYGLLAGALPSGRKAREFLSDAGVSPYPGYDKYGPTAVLMSVSKIDHVHYKRGTLLNQRLAPAVLAGEKGKLLFRNYVKAWADLNIFHVQFNVVSSEELKDAQIHPEKYSDLIVRVAGYSAYFNHLTKAAQDSIIQRTEQVLV